jgi:hypothetical protein
MRPGGVESSRMPRRLLLAALALVTAVSTPVLAAGHGEHGPGGKPGRWVAPPDDHWQGHGLDPTNPQACDSLDPAQCMLPYPDDWFTRPDTTSATGRRLDLNVLAMPRNVEGKPIEPQEWNRSDGFSAGAQILTVVPGLTKNSDLTSAHVPTVTDLSENSDPAAGVVLLDTATGERWPVWAEVDQYTQMAGPEPSLDVQQDLMIHPARNLTDGHRYIVALRGLVTDSGAPATPSAAFVAYRDGTSPASDPRTAHMNNLFRTLAQAGISRQSLYMAWDFTTASTQNVTGRLIAIRNDAFAQLGESREQLRRGKVVGHAPSFTVDTVTDYTPAQNSAIARQITGHFTVPCYLFPTCEPPTKCNTVTSGTFDDCPTPSQFLLDPTNPDAVPQQTPGQTYQANFICNAGRKAFDAHQLMRPVEYGHGLFGGAGEVNSDAETSMANGHGMLYCATDWTGMASADVPNAVVALHDLSRFPLLTDRVQQGELNFLYLARLLVHPQGFAANPAFQWSDHQTFIDTSGVFYDGNSQGGIFGGTVCAVSVDVRRCALGVPGMDYSILLPRSSDYVADHAILATDPSTLNPTDPTSAVGYSDLLDTSYPDQGQRMLILDLLQTLWDRSDPNGYATHMTGGLPDTPHHDVLLQLAYGDHQVANITAEDEARTIGAVAMRPAVVPQRFGPYQDPFWGLATFPGGSYDGSGIVIFDSGPAGNVTPQGHRGTDPPPTMDVPNRSGDDPHEAPRRAPCGQQMKSAFLAVNGVLTAPCGGAPYFSWGWDGVSGLSTGA